MSEQRRWIKEWQSDSLDLALIALGELNFAEWFNKRYELCKLCLQKAAAEAGVNPDALSYDVRVEEKRWDLCFIVTATEVAR